jgi:hypothetical protein
MPVRLPHEEKNTTHHAGAWSPRLKAGPFHRAPARISDPSFEEGGPCASTVGGVPLYLTGIGSNLDCSHRGRIPQPKAFTTEVAEDTESTEARVGKWEFIEPAAA